MKILKFLLIVIIIGTIFSCKTQQKVAKQKESKHEVDHSHWAYAGENNPSNWSHIKDEYVACDGHSQSPIDIKDAMAVQPEKKNNLNLNYRKSSIDILNNGHTEEFVISKGNSLQFNGKTYQLKQFHMHTLSEHTVNGKHFPLEIHFVNKADDNTYAVISVLVKEGEESTFLNTYLGHFPKHEGEYKQDGELEIMTVLPNTDHYYHYKGSFTTPPCTEVVEWIVLKEHPTASKEQLETLHKLMHDNYRPLQALNTRVIDTQ